MNRQMWLLAGLGLVLVLVLYFLFLWRPRTQELAEATEQIEETQQQQDQARADIARLEAVRANAPEFEAAISAANSVIPQDEALPAALRQLQLAADDSGLTLLTVTPGRPAEVAPPEGEEQDGGEAAPEADGQLAQISLSVQVTGNYFQVVDFLRRVEDPTIVPRGIVWTTASVTAEDYPTLNASLTGQMFARLPVADVADEEGDGTPDEPEPAPTGTPGPTETATATEGP